MFKIVATVLLTCILITSCGVSSERSSKWKVTLSREDKQPYGSYLAFQSLKLYFPEAKIKTLSDGFRYTNVNNIAGHKDQSSMLIAVGLDFYVSDEELQGLLSFASKGNEIIIFARSLDEKIEKILNSRIKGNGLEEVRLTPYYDGSENDSILSIPWIKNKKYGYQGHSLKASFVSRDPDSTSNPAKPITDTDSTWRKNEGAGYISDVHRVTDTLGYSNGNPNFLRFRIGKGHISLHSGPLVLSNYFILQKGNQDYIQGLWQTIPVPIHHIFWNDYFKRTSESSDLNVLLRYPATRWALIIAAITLLVYVFFEIKRRQRIIPVIKPLDNSSVSFVETVGRLYYNQGDHANLADKMIQHFLEWVRTHYYINTTILDEQFISQLRQKSGLSENVVQSLVETINDFNSKRKLPNETDLYYLHSTIQQFYKNHRR